MNKKRMQRWRVSPPKTVSIKLLKECIESLEDFMPGLNTTKRTIETVVAANGELNTQVGLDSWKAYQPFALDKIESIQFELTLNKTEQSSCQIHVEFKQEHIFLSVSDIDTGWIDAVFEEMERNLKSSGLFRGELGYKLTATILRLQNVFLMAGIIIVFFPKHYDLDFFYAGLFLMMTGIIPVITDIFRIFSPQKPIQILEEKMTLAPVNVEKVAIWVGLVSGIVALGKELLTAVFSFVG